MALCTAGPKLPFGINQRETSWWTYPTHTLSGLKSCQSQPTGRSIEINIPTSIGNFKSRPRLARRRYHSYTHPTDRSEHRIDLSRPTTRRERRRRIGSMDFSRWQRSRNHTERAHADTTPCHCHRILPTRRHCRHPCAFVIGTTTGGDAGSVIRLAWERSGIRRVTLAAYRMGTGARTARL